MYLQRLLNLFIDIFVSNANGHAKLAEAALMFFGGGDSCYVKEANVSAI